jgi:hypothetical protein
MPRKEGELSVLMIHADGNNRHISKEKLSRNTRSYGIPILEFADWCKHTIPIYINAELSPTFISAGVQAHFHSIPGIFQICWP